MQPQNPFQPQQGQPTQPGFQGSASPYQPQQYQAPAQNYGTPQQQPYVGTEPQPAVANVTQYPVDYLNQIAQPVPVKKASPMFIFGIIGAVLLIAGLAMFMLIKSTAPPDVGTQLYGLQARLETLTSVMSNTGSRLTQSNLSSINSGLGATMKSMQADLKAYMDGRGLKDKKSADAAQKSEASYAAKLSQTLDDAYLTGTLDRSYSSEMTYQLTILKSKLQKVKATAKSKAFNELYDKNVPSLDTQSDLLTKFQSTK